MRRDGVNLMAVTGLIFLALFKALIFWAYYDGFIPEFGYYFVLNPLTSFVLYILMTYYFSGKGKDNFITYICTFIDLVLSFYGTLALIMFTFLYFLLRKSYEGTERDIYSDVYQDKNLLRKLRIKETMVRGEERRSEQRKMLDRLVITPYVDIFADRNLQMKISAVEKLSQEETRESVTVLKKAIKSPDYEVRYFANSVLEKIQDTSMKSIKSLENQIKRNPLDADIYLERGNVYLNLVYIGILDESMREFFLKKAFNDYFLVYQLSGGQRSVWERIARLFREKKDCEGVLEVVNRALSVEADREERAKLLFTRAEANFSLRRFGKVVEDCALVAESDLKYEKIVFSVNWWKNVKSCNP